MRKEDKKLAKIEAQASKLAAESGEDKEVLCLSAYFLA